MRIIKSNKMSDIISINQRSIYAKSEICIIELSTLNELIPSDEAEAMREKWKSRKIQVKQLSNMQNFESWTDVGGFIKTCMSIRQVDVSVLPIKAEVLVFDDVVAFYRVKPEISILVIEDDDFANQQRALFTAIWEKAKPLSLNSDGSTK